MAYRIWSVKKYSMNKDDFKNLIENKYIEYDDIKEICNVLEDEDNSYHFRVFEKQRYIFFCDIDGYKKDIEQYMEVLFDFLKRKYNLDKEYYYYTQNTHTNGSYHLSIPSWNTTTEKLKEIMTKFKEEMNDHEDFVICTKTGTKKKIIDTSIYSDHWFRCPNQSKGDGSSGIHEIIRGNMRHFVIDYIPQNSKSIDNVQFIEDKIVKEVAKTEKGIKEIDKTEKVKKEVIKKEKLTKEEVVQDEKVIKKIKEKKIYIIKRFLELYIDEYYDDYNFWYKIGMGLKKLGSKYDYDFQDDFRTFSKKSSKYNETDFNKFWNGFDITKITINEGTLYKYARDCNISEYKKIVKELYELQKIEITEKYIVETLKEIAGDYFIYVNEELYCFNVRNKLWYIGDDTMKKYINDELYDYLFNLITDSITDETTYKNQLKELKNYCLKVKGQELLAKAFRIRHRNEKNKKIIFNENKFLFGFDNGVYDLITKEFRKYKYDDYITLNCGYEYEKGNDDEKKELEDVLKKIMPDDDKRHLLLQILSTGLIGRAYQNLFIFNGCGGNGKSSVTKLMKIVLGNYYYKLDSKYLFENSRQGANPELANLSYKRYVNSSEPPASKKIKNSIYKSLTGDGEIEARKCNSNDTKVKINATFIIECNKRPLLEEEPTEADARRIIDLLFNSKFTLNSDEVNESKHIYKANKKYEDSEQLEKFKHTFFEILAEYAYNFLTKENEIFSIPNSVKERSQEYLNSSYQYLQYLKELCEKVDDQTKFIQIGELSKKIEKSSLYINSTKEERKKINLKSLVSFLRSNSTTLMHYKELHRPYVNNVQKGYTHVLLGYEFVKDDDNDE